MLSRASGLLPLALTFSLFACTETATGPDGESARRFGTGKGFTLLLTDAPGDFEAAVVTISQINLQGSGKAVGLLDESFTGDLLELRNEVATLVQGLELPAGSYSQLRLVIDGAYIEVETEDGTMIYASSPDYEGLPVDAEVDGTLHMPSMGQSGLKINLPGGKVEIGEGETIMMLDFDVEESFGHQAGKSGKWVMNPVIKATDVSFAGNALIRLQLGQGVTLPPLNGTAVTLGDFTALLVTAADDTTRIKLTDADADGTFEAMFKGLAPGTYQLSIVGPAGLVVGFGSTFPLTVTVAEKSTATQLVTVTSAAQTGTVVATLKLNTGVTLPSIGTPPVAVTLSQFKAQLTAGSTTTEVAFSDANADGIFEASFPNRAPGTYTLNIAKPAGINVTYDVASPVTVTLAAGATDTRPFVITGASVATP